MTIKPASTSRRKTGKTLRTVVKKQARRTASCSTTGYGELCPQCQKGKLDYDGCLNLVCPICGFIAPFVGGFT